MEDHSSNAILRLSLFVLICALALSGMVSAQRESDERAPSEQKQHLPKITPSSLMSLLAKRMKEQPGLSPKELAAYANTILAHEGFNYRFDLCEMIGVKRGEVPPYTSEPKTYLLPMTATDGNKVTFRISSVTVEMEGMCGECFFSIPCLSVTKQDLLVVSKGRRYHLKRSKQMDLDEMSLVDDTMKRVLRTWQVPYQTVPAGISEDGTKLYLDLNQEGEEDVFGKLILEISETGLQIQARDEVHVKKGEWLEDAPTDPKNAYLSFMRFRVQGQSYIVRFSSPCT